MKVSNRSLRWKRLCGEKCCPPSHMRTAPPLWSIGWTLSPSEVHKSFPLTLPSERKSTFIHRCQNIGLLIACEVVIVRLFSGFMERQNSWDSHHHLFFCLGVCLDWVNVQCTGCLIFTFLFLVKCSFKKNADLFNLNLKTTWMNVVLVLALMSLGQRAAWQH